MGSFLAVTLTSALLVAVPLANAPDASAATGDAGTRGPSLSGFANSTPTATKPESKLWFANGWWWASMASAVTGGYRIHRLDRASSTWVDTGVDLDPRGATQADALWNGEHLFVASHAVAASSTSTSTSQPARLYRYSWDGTTWTPDAGFPVTITSSSSESLTIAQTDAGRIWATWTQGRRLYLAQTSGSADARSVSFNTPYVPRMANLASADSTAATTLNADDISTVASADGVTTLLWSNQVTGTTWSARRTDAGSTWSAIPVVSGALMSDDHVSLRAIPGDAARRVVAVFKTSFNDAVPAVPTDPLLVAAVFTPASGAWATATVATVAESATRPVAVVGPGGDDLRVFYTGPSTPGSVASEGTIYEKDSTLSALTFPTGGTPVLRDIANATMNNVTTTARRRRPPPASSCSPRPSPRPATGSAPSGGSVAAPALAAFTSAATAGGSPRQVTFTDRSAGSPTSWSWDFGDGATSTQRNPTHVYASAGAVTVRLTVDNAAGPASSVTRTMAVGSPPVASFTVSQPSRAVLALEVTDTSTGSPDEVDVGLRRRHTRARRPNSGRHGAPRLRAGGHLPDLAHRHQRRGLRRRSTTPRPRPGPTRRSSPRRRCGWRSPRDRCPVRARWSSPGRCRTLAVCASTSTAWCARPRERSARSTSRRPTAAPAPAGSARGSVTLLKAGKRYTCAVSAHNAAGWSVPSPGTSPFTARA